MNLRIAVAILVGLVATVAMTACIVEQKSQGKFANAFIRSMRVAARNSDAYIKKVITTTQNAVQRGDTVKLKTLFSGQDSATAIKAYRNTIEEQLQSSQQVGKSLNSLLDESIVKHSSRITTQENRFILGFSSIIDKTSTALNAHVKLMRDKHADLNKLIELDLKAKELQQVAEKWRGSSNMSLQLNARKIDYVSYQVKTIKQLQAGETWAIGENHQGKMLTALTDVQRRLFQDEKLWSSNNLHDAVLKRLQRINDLYDPFKTIGTSQPARTVSEEASLRQEIGLLLDMDDRFLRQLKK